ncbi:Ku protein [Paenibacillus sp. MCAF20]
MNTVWKGAISFGLVHVPVKMFTSTDEKDISFRTLHKTCSSPISQTRTCSHCNTKVGTDDTIKGYEYETGKFVLFNEDEIDALKPESAKVIQLTQVPNLPAQITVSDNELQVAQMLINHLSETFQPEKYTDEYRTALLTAIERKVSGQSLDVVEAPKTGTTNVLDLMAALQASVEAAKPKGNVS